MNDCSHHCVMRRVATVVVAAVAATEFVLVAQAAVIESSSRNQTSPHVHPNPCCCVVVSRIGTTIAMRTNCMSRDAVPLVRVALPHPVDTWTNKFVPAAATHCSFVASMDTMTIVVAAWCWIV